MRHADFCSDTDRKRWVRRSVILLFILFITALQSPAQTGSWTWVGGKTTTFVATVMSSSDGISDPCNIPGNRVGGNTWVDPEGNLWMQGGDRSYIRTNELWKFDPLTNAWARMKSSNSSYAVYGSLGVESPTNIPGGRIHAYNWMDAAGNFWYFGGDGFGAGGAGQMNDLWFYNRGTNNWKWVWGGTNPGYYGGYGHPKGTAGPNNAPGGRSGGAYWIGGDGKLWMMGGLGYGTPYSYGHLNEVWNYDPATGYWTWVSGNNTSDHYGIYGIKGIPAATNMPGGRAYFDSWKDANGDIWIFGGYGYGESGGVGYLNDLWKYSPDSNLWTWMGGPKTPNVTGTYGSLGVLDAASWPGARANYEAFVDSDGKFWLFGGNNLAGKFNDWWMFDPNQDGLCGYMGGVGVVNANGIYGSLGVTEYGVYPGARTQMYGWSGADGTLWIFGGNGYGISGSGYLNDMWAFNFTANMLYRDSDADGTKNACDTDDDADGIPDGEDVCQYVNQATINCDDGNAATYDFFDIQICDCSHIALDADNDGYTYDVDCNDNDATINPGRPFDFVNGIDENCDGVVDNTAPNNAFNMPVEPSATSVIVVEHDEALIFNDTTSATIEFWLRAPQDLYATHIISKRPMNFYPIDFQIAYIRDVGIELNKGFGPPINTEFIPPHNEWTHLAVSYSFNPATGGVITMYVNGCYYNEWNASLFNFVSSHNPLTIGNILLPEWGSWGNPEYKGDLDEVRIWKVARTAAEIQASYNTIIDPMDNPGLVAYYTFDQGIAGGDNTAITQVFDATLNGLHGTIQNLPMTGDQGNFVNGWSFTPVFNWYYTDADGDGYGDADDEGLYVDCHPGTGYVLNNSDCNDAEFTIHPDATEICGNLIDDNCDGAIDENCCAITVDAGAPEYLYYGFAADQSVTMTAVITGGMAPFTYAWTLDRALLYDVETPTGDESMINANTQAVTISLMDTAMLYITVTDALGCQAVDSVMIYAEDVRCFKGDKEKVLICHSTGSAKNPWTQMCIDAEAVDAHLAHGDYLGKCGTPRESFFSDEAGVRAMHIYPNPSDGHCTVVLSLPDVPDGEIFLHVSDLTGRVLMAELGYLEAGGVEFELHLDANFASGIYMVWTDINGTILHKNMVINR